MNMSFFTMANITELRAAELVDCVDDHDRLADNVFRAVERIHIAMVRLQSTLTTADDDARRILDSMMARFPPKQSTS